MTNLNNKIKTLVNSLTVKEIKTEPCLSCYTCCEVDVEQCGSLMNRYRLQWFEILSEDAEGFGSYAEYDFYIDFSNKKELNKRLKSLHESEIENIQYVLENSSKFDFELIKFNRG
jgi:hypothetical protein